MKKEYIIGGLAIIGAVALFAYLTPRGTKRNSDGFFGASGGRMMSGTGSMNKPLVRLCVHTNPDRSTNSYSPYGGTRCNKGDVIRWI
jgi:hypothetical protein